jgi:hypothetical protein
MNETSSYYLRLILTSFRFSQLELMTAPVTPHHSQIGGRPEGVLLIEKLCSTGMGRVTRPPSPFSWMRRLKPKNPCCGGAANTVEQPYHSHAILLL